MTRISNVSNLLLSATAGAVATLAIQSAPASAATLTIAPTTVSATSSPGLPLTASSNFLGTDTLTLNVTGGTANLNPNGNGYITNAAGVLTQNSTAAALSAGQSSIGPNSASNGALLIGNSDLGFFQLFPTNSANGLGSSNPITTFSFNNTLASIFGTGLATSPTSTLYLFVNDFQSPDNAGGYSVNGAVTAAAAVPEPFTIIGTLVGGTAAVRMRKKLQAVNK